MNRLLFVGLSALFCLSALPLRAQDVSQTSRRPGSALSASSEPDWFNTTISLDFKNLSIVDAIKKILDAAKVKYDRVEVSFDLPKTKLSFSGKELNTRDALAAMARFVGAQAYVAMEDGKTVIELRKRVAETTLMGNFATSSSPFSVGGLTGQRTITLPGPSLRTEAYKDLPNKSLDVTIKNGNTNDLIKQIAEKAGIDYEIESGLKGKEADLSLTLRGISVGSALDLAAGWLDCGWKAEKKGDKVKVFFSKKYSKPVGSMIYMPPVMSTPPMFRMTLPNTAVSLDKTKADPRECLKDILKQAELSYAIGDDLPSEPKSFTFSNVSITTALEMICESIGASWSVERSPDGKPLVRVRKGRGRSRSSLGGIDTPLSRYLDTRQTSPSRSIRILDETTLV